MATKELFSLKGKQQTFANNNSHIGDSDFKLNQNHKFSNFSPIQSKSKSNNEKATLKLPDSTVTENRERKGKLQTWKKSPKFSVVSSTVNDKTDEEVKGYGKKDVSLNSTTKNNSTLSLHISTYENSVDTVSDEFDGKNKEKNGKQIFDASISVIQNAFEFPRQQNDKRSETEMSNFKASQRLFNPNNKASKNGGQQNDALQQRFTPSSLDSLLNLRNQIGPIFGALFVSSVLLQKKKPMILPRLKPSTVLPLARSLTVSSYRYASQGNTQLFKDINRLAREGKWDAINNAPKPFLRGDAKEEANAVYAKVIQPEDSFAKYGGQPYGPWVFLVTRVAVYFTGLFIICKAYELIVPEQYRLHYKYRPKKHHHDDDGEHH